MKSKVNEGIIVAMFAVAVTMSVGTLIGVILDWHSALWALAVGGLIWGVSTYFLWWFCTTMAPSLFWDDSEPPENLSLIPMGVALLWPLAFLVGAIIFIFAFVLSGIESIADSLNEKKPTAPA